MNINLKLLLEGTKETFSPKRNLKEFLEFNFKEYILMALMVGASIVAFVYGKDYSWIGWIGGLTSVATAMSLILVDKGKLTNYLWGTIGSVAWLVASINNRLIGDIGSQIFYTVMQFVGIYVWYKTLKGLDHDTVISKKVTPMMAILTLIGLVMLYAVNVYVSFKLHGNQIWLDATLLPLGIIGQILMTYGYRSQWVAWITLDAINVYIWYVQLSNGGSAATSMFVLQIIMLINALYGTYCWYKQEVKEKQEVIHNI